MEVKIILRIIIFSQIRSTFSSTENTFLDSLKGVITKQTHFLYKDEDGYNQCIMLMSNENGGIDKVFGPFFQFQGEGINVELGCSSCYPNSVNAFIWWSLSLFNEKSKVVNSHKFHISESGKKLTINNPRTEDSLTYFCASSSNDLVFNIHTVELLPIRKLNKINARNGPFKEESETRHYRNLEIATKWTSWSSCSRCDVPGRKHRFGECIIRQFHTGKYNDFDFHTFKIFPFLSCSLFVFLNPEIGNENQKLTKFLTKEKGKIMLGYCKIPCARISNDPELDEIPSEIVYLYQQKAKENDDQNFGFISLLPPWGKEHITALICFFALLIAQLIFIIRICENKRKAI